MIYCIFPNQGSLEGLVWVIRCLDLCAPCSFEQVQVILDVGDLKHLEAWVSLRHTG